MEQPTASTGMRIVFYGMIGMSVFFAAVGIALLAQMNVLGILVLFFGVGFLHMTLEDWHTRHPAMELSSTQKRFAAGIQATMNILAGVLALLCLLGIFKMLAFVGDSINFLFRWIN